MKKQLLSILLIPVILLTACTSTVSAPEPGQTDSAENDIYASETAALMDGRMATNIKEHNGLYYVSNIDPATNDCAITVYDASFSLLYELDDAYFGLDPRYCLMSAFDIYDGCIYFMAVRSFTSTDDRVLVQYDLESGKEVQRIRIAAALDIWDGGALSDLYVRDSYFLLESTVGIQICSMDGTAVKEICSSNKSEYYITCSAADDAFVYYGCREDTTPYLCKAELATGKLIWRYKLTDGTAIRNIAVCADGIIVQNDQDILLFDGQGKAPVFLLDIRDHNKTVISSEDSSFYIYIIGLIGKPQELFYLYSPYLTRSSIVKIKTLDGHEKDQAISQAQAQKQQARTLRLFLPYEDIAIKDLIYDFEKQNNVTIEAEYYAESFTDFNVQDYLQLVSTRILSGTSEWDIMSTELIPYIQYAKEGKFADLYSLDGASVLRDTERFYTNIFESSADGERLYYFPMRLAFTGYFAADELASEISDMEDILQLCLTSRITVKHPAESLFSKAFRYLFTQFLRTDYRDFRFNEARYRELAETLKEVYTLNCYTDYGSQQTYDLNVSEEANISEGLDLTAYLSFHYLSEKDGTVPYRMSKGYAIMEDSDEKALALEFLIYVSEHYKRNYSPSKQNMRSNFLAMNYSSIYGTTEEEFIKNRDAFMKKADSIMALANCNQYQHTDLYSVAYDATRAYIKGEIPLDTAAAQIRQTFDILHAETDNEP